MKAGYSIYNGFAIVPCTHRRETVWVVYAASNGEIAVPLKEVCRAGTRGLAKAHIDWMIAKGKV